MKENKSISSRNYIIISKSYIALHSGRFYDRIILLIQQIDVSSFNWMQRIMNQFRLQGFLESIMTTTGSKYSLTLLLQKVFQGHSSNLKQSTSTLKFISMGTFHQYLCYKSFNDHKRNSQSDATRPQIVLLTVYRTLDVQNASEYCLQCQLLSGNRLVFGKFILFYFVIFIPKLHICREMGVCRTNNIRPRIVDINGRVEHCLYKHSTS